MLFTVKESTLWSDNVAHSIILLNINHQAVNSVLDKIATEVVVMEQ